MHEEYEEEILDEECSLESHEQYMRDCLEDERLEIARRMGM
jgi:hypothetical protein